MSLDKHEDATYYHVYFAHLGAYTHPGRLFILLYSSYRNT